MRILRPLRPLRFGRGARGALLVLVAGLGSCGTFPLRLFVDTPVLEELEGPAYRENVAWNARARIQAALGLDKRPALPPGRSFQRAERPVLAPEEAPPEALDDAAHPLVSDLRPGDLLLAKNAKATSLLSTLALEPFTFYDHAGILVRDGERLAVVESWPVLELGGDARDFASRYVGTVARVPLSAFLKRYDVVEFVRPGDSQLGRAIAREAQAATTEDIRFDPYHDPTTSDALSCVELVVEVLGRAGREVSVPPARVSPNASVTRAHRSLGFHVESYWPVDHLAHMGGVTSVAVLSTHGGHGPTEALREAYRMLHDRFGQEGRLADYADVHPLRLVSLRTHVRAFLAWARGIGAGGDTDVLETLWEILFVER